MPRKKPSEDEILACLRKVDTLTSEGMSISDAIASVGLSERTYARWRKAQADAILPIASAPDRIESSLRRDLPDLDEPILPLGERIEGPRDFPIVPEPRWHPLRWVGVACGCLVVLGAGAFFLMPSDDMVPAATAIDAGPQESVGRLVGEIDGLKRSLTALQSEVERIRTDALGRPAPAQPASASVDRAEIDRLGADLKAQIDVLWKGAADDRASLAAVKTRLETLPVPTSTKQLDALKSELVDAISAVEARRAKTAGEIGALRSALEAQGRRTVLKLAELESQLARAADRSANLERQRTADDGRIAALEKADAAVETRLATVAPPPSSPPGHVPDELWMPYDMSIAAPAVTVAARPRSEKDEAPPVTGSLPGPDKQSLAALAAPRVVLRYVGQGPQVTARVGALQAALDKRGFVVTTSPGGTAGAQANTVAYYYAQDRPIAEEIATSLPKATVVQRKFSVDSSLPRPGSIEIAIVE